MRRLHEWLRAAAEGSLDPIGMPLHPPVAYNVGHLVIPQRDVRARGLCGLGGQAPERQRGADRGARPGRPFDAAAACVDDVVVRAAIHPGIGVARAGDSVDGFFVGPEVTDPPDAPVGAYRDAWGAIKRQAARFRIFGYYAAGSVVRELTSEVPTSAGRCTSPTRRPLGTASRPRWTCPRRQR